MGLQINLEGNTERRNQEDTAPAGAGFTFVLGIAGQAAVENVSGRGEGVALAGGNTQPDFSQAIQSRPCPADGEHYSFSRWASNSAVL